MSAREKILDSYQSVLLEEGERAATMEQVAAHAGVSKGGLLYHFKDKSAMAEALLQRVRDLLQEDAQQMASAPEGSAAYYLRSSLLQDDQLDRALVAVMSLPNEHDTAKVAVYREVQDRWFSLIQQEVKDPAITDAIMLMGDGLYSNASLTSTIADAPGDREADEGRMRGLEKVLDLLRAAGSGTETGAQNPD